MIRPHSVQFIDNYFPVIDGVTETVHQYAKHMDAAVVCPAMESRYLEKHDFPYKVLTSATLRAPFSRYAVTVPGLDPKLRAAIEQEHADIFHFHSQTMQGKYVISLGRKTGVPVVASFHSKCYDAILEFIKSKTMAKELTRQIVRMYEDADEVWTCSEETGETLRSYGFRKPYYVVPNGTDVSVPAHPEELKERAAERFRIPRDRHILLFVGQQIWYKNQRLILDAFRLLCDKSDDYFLVMAGSGKDEKEIERYAASLGLTDRQIRFTGLVSDRDLLNGIYLSADLLFFPSVFDNAPLVLREAAVLAVPTLATEGSNAAGAIRKDFNGYTAADTPQAMCGEILRIFTETDIRQVGRNAQQTIPVSWENLAQQVLERYGTVIGRYRSRTGKR